LIAPAFKRLFIDHAAPVAFHRGIVRRNELCREHSFNSSFGPIPISAAMVAVR
jgi:hypothetical protein